MEQSLIDYIIKNIEKGHHPDKIKQALIKSGHNPYLVNEHISHAYSLTIKKRKLKILLKSLIALTVISFLAFYLLLHFHGGTAKIKPAIHTINQTKDAEQLNSALIGNDPSACSEIQEVSLKEKCLARFSVPEKIQECNEECKDRNLLNKALIGMNKSICPQIINEAIKKQCIIAVV